MQQEAKKVAAEAAAEKRILQQEAKKEVAAEAAAEKRILQQEAKKVAAEAAAEKRRLQQEAKKAAAKAAAEKRRSQEEECATKAAEAADRSRQEAEAKKAVVDATAARKKHEFRRQAGKAGIEIYQAKTGIEIYQATSGEHREVQAFSTNEAAGSQVHINSSTDAEKRRLQQGANTVAAAAAAEKRRLQQEAKKAAAKTAAEKRRLQPDAKKAAAKAADEKRRLQEEECATKAAEAADRSRQEAETEKAVVDATAARKKNEFRLQAAKTGIDICQAKSGEYHERELENKQQDTTRAIELPIAESDEKAESKPARNPWDDLVMRSRVGEKSTEHTNTKEESSIYSVSRRASSDSSEYSEHSRPYSQMSQSYSEDTREATKDAGVFGFIQQMIQGREEDDLSTTSDAKLKRTISRRAVSRASETEDEETVVSAVSRASETEDEETVQSVDTFDKIQEAVRVVKRHASRIGVHEKQLIQEMAKDKEENEDFIGTVGKMTDNLFNPW